MVGSLGIITLTAGTPVRLTVNQTTPANRLGAISVRIQAHPNNAGPVYVGLANMEASPLGPGLLGVIAKPVSATTGPYDSFEITINNIPAGLNLADLYVDGTTSDGVIVSYTAN